MVIYNGIVFVNHTGLDTVFAHNAATGAPIAMPEIAGYPVNAVDDALLIRKGLFLTVINTADFTTIGSVLIPQVSSPDKPATATLLNRHKIVVYNGAVTDYYNYSAVDIPSIDEYFENVSLLLHMNGTNLSTTFIDSSSNAFAVTSSNALITTSYSRFGGSSGAFNGSTPSYLTIPSNAAFNFGTNDFTIECWVHPTLGATSAYQGIACHDSIGGTRGWLLFMDVSTGYLNFAAWSGATNALCSSTVTPNINALNFIQVNRVSGVFNLYLNGVLIASNSVNTTLSVGFPTTPVCIGSLYGVSGVTTNSAFSGYVDDLRITKGVSRVPQVPVVEFPNDAKVYAKWNASDKSSTITLSSDQLTATTASGSSGLVRSTIGKSSGKWYWEHTIANPAGMVGIAKSNANINQYPGNDNDGWGYFHNGNKYNAGSASVYGASFTNSFGSVIGFALDMDAGTLTCFKDGTNQGLLASGLTGTMYAACGGVGGGVTQYLYNFGETAFAYAPPAGFNAGLYS